MRSVKGRYDGSVVVLEEPAPLDYKGEVVVGFPEPEPAPPAPERVFHWLQRAPGDTFEGSFADEVIRQRRME